MHNKTRQLTGMALIPYATKAAIIAEAMPKRKPLVCSLLWFSIVNEFAGRVLLCALQRAFPAAMTAFCAAILGPVKYMFTTSASRSEDFSWMLPLSHRRKIVEA
eukprot:GEMP01078394.1.p1 GENE.GEMP01078394.1~~GEMP01078394.1.p1  ORF type:complete len:104 (-),score=7.81 GEMP01078394.1:350-661(-)